LVNLFSRGFIPRGTGVVQRAPAVQPVQEYAEPMEVMPENIIEMSMAHDADFNDFDSIDYKIE